MSDAIHMDFEYIVPVVDPRPGGDVEIHLNMLIMNPQEGLLLDCTILGTGWGLEAASQDFSLDTSCAKTPIMIKTKFRPDYTANGPETLKLCFLHGTRFSGSFDVIIPVDKPTDTN